MGGRNVQLKSAFFFKIEADLSEREKQELIEMGKKYSPVYNTLTKSVPANVKLDK